MKGLDNLYLVVDINEEMCIYFEGTKEECENFLKDDVTKEVFEVGAISAQIISAEEYNRRFSE